MEKIVLNCELPDEDKQIKLVRRNSLVQEFVLADGIGSSGKVMLSHVMASFERVEKCRIDLLFDTVPRLFMLGKISHDAAVVMLQTEADMLLYYNMISRGVNFRFKDGTGILKNPYPMKYLKRLFAEERMPVLEKIRSEKPIFQNTTHDALLNASIFFDAFEERIRIAYIMRDPIEISHDWLTRGFGSRIAKDPLELQFSYEWKDDVVPLYAYGWEDEYLSSDSADRVIGMVAYLMRGNVNSYHNMAHERQKKVMFVLFDEFVSNPMHICNKLASFIGTKITIRTRKALKRENCPRIISPIEKQRKRKFVEQGATIKYKNMLNELVNEYQTFKRQIT